MFSSSLYGALALERQSMIHFYNLIGIVDDVVCAIDHPLDHPIHPKRVSSASNTKKVAASLEGVIPIGEVSHAKIEL